MRLLSRLAFILLILGAALIIALPSVRRELAWSLALLRKSIIDFDDTNYEVGRFSLAGKKLLANDARIKEELISRPDDLNLRIAVLLASFSDPQLISDEVYERAFDEVYGYPSLGAVEAALISRMLAIWTVDEFKRSEELNSPNEEVLLADDAVEEFVATIDEWGKREPDNAAPDFYASYFLLGAKRDKEALTRAQSAANKSYFSLHEAEHMESLVHLFKVLGYPDPDSELFADSILPMQFDLITGLNSWTNIMISLGQDYYDAGDKKTAFAYWEPVFRVNNLVLSNTHITFLQHAMLAMSQQEMLKPIWVIRDKPSAGAQGEEYEIVPGKIHAEYVAALGSDRVSQIRDELKHIKDLTQELTGGGIARLTSDLFRASNYRRVRALHMVVLPAYIAVALFWVVFSALILVRRASGRHLAVVAISTTIGLLPILFCFSVTLLNMISDSVWSSALNRHMQSTAGSYPAPSPSLDERLTEQFLSNKSIQSARTSLHMFSLPETPPGNLALIFSGPLLLIIAAALLSIKTARASHVRFRKAFVVSTQQALSIMLVFLFAAWLGSTYLVIREGSRITHYAARTRQVGELQMYREYMRDSGK